MIVLDGKKTSSDIKAEIAESVKEIVAKGSRPPHLAAVIVGDDGASLTYVGSKVRACKRVGFESTRLEKEKITFFGLRRLSGLQNQVGRQMLKANSFQDF